MFFIALSIELVPESELSHNIHSESFAKWRHVDDGLLHATAQKLEEKFRNLLLHVGFKDGHGAFRDHGTSNAALPSVLVFFDGVEKIGGPFAAHTRSKVSSSLSHARVAIDVCPCSESTTVLRNRVSDLPCIAAGVLKMRRFGATRTTEPSLC
jgi:hypothetical protein